MNYFKYLRKQKKLQLILFLIGIGASTYITFFMYHNWYENPRLKKENKEYKDQNIKHW